MFRDFFFSNLKSAFPCFRTRDPWKQTPQHSSCRRKILTSDQAFSFVVRVTRDERSDRACLVCAHHATHTRALQRNRHARTWNPNSRCLNRFMEKRVIFWCTMLTRIIMVFFFFFFFNVIVSMIRYSNRIIFVWLKYRWFIKATIFHTFLYRIKVHRALYVSNLFSLRISREFYSFKKSAHILSNKFN